MKEEYDCEVPLSNEEVLKVLKAKKTTNSKCVEIIEYLETVQKPYKYTMEILRDMKDLEADLITLTVLSNTNDTDVVCASDLKKINKKLNM